LNTRLYALLGGTIGLFILAQFFPILFAFAQFGIVIIAVLFGIDIFMLYRFEGACSAKRIVPEKLSNGDQNAIRLYIENRYPFDIVCSIIDEVPFQFQLRDLLFESAIQARSTKQLQYLLRPVERGEYHFGTLNVYATGPIGFCKRRYQFGEEHKVPTYPSYIQMRQYQIMAISNRLTEVGVKKIRRLGNSSEFEQIKEYVRGDDYRTVNWKATARAGKLMVNQYTDARAQNVYCLIDKSRVMRMPFEGMTLLDYAINASLVMSNIAIYRHDKAGLISFAENVDTYLPASSRPTQMNRIMEALYKQDTEFKEADYGRLYAWVRRKITHRSLLILFTNFEAIESMRRQLSFLKRLGRSHLLLVVFFENTELKRLLSSTPKDTEGIYVKAIGENFAYQKRQIVKELEVNGILSIITPPQKLTINTLNKYLEMKAKGMI